MRFYPTNRKRRNSDCGIASVSTASGRIAGEKNDCTVRALSEAAEISYIEAYAMLAGAGRKARHGFHFEKFMNENYPDLNPMPRPKMTVARYIQFIACEGNWMIKIRGHVFAVKEQVIYDIVPTASLNRHVLTAWRVK